MYSKYLSLFKELRDKVDMNCSKLWAVHHRHMQCKRTCSSCCQSFKVLPVEFHYIQEEIRNMPIEINKNARSGECKFLINDECTIYNSRPIICRTHGYPLARYNDEAGAYEISYCTLNFRNYKLDDFNTGNVLYEDDYNNEFFELNKEFIKNNKLCDYDYIELLAVNDIKT